MPNFMATPPVAQVDGLISPITIELLKEASFLSKVDLQVLFAVCYYIIMQYLHHTEQTNKQ